MSLQERLAAQDATKLIGVASSLSLFYSYSTNGVTNFALFLFGIIAHEMTSTTAPLQQFVVLIIFTGFFDIIRLPNVGVFSLGGICALAVILLKVPIFFTCLAKLQERGGDVRLGPGSFGFQNTPNWSMPASFRGQQTSGQGPVAPPPPPGAFPSGGGFRLGGEEDEPNSGGPPPAPAPGRNGYSSIA